MTDTVYYIICGVLSIGVLLGINMMSKVKSAVKGNRLSALCMLAAVCVTLYKYQIFSAGMMWAGLAIGAAIGIYLTIKVEMITMPQTVALLNGLGGAASAVAALLTLAAVNSQAGIFAIVTGGIALAVGALTFSGSLIAAGKLHKLLPQKPTVLPAHQALTTVSFLGMIAFIVLLPIKPELMMNISVAGLVISLLFGIFFAMIFGDAGYGGILVLLSLIGIGKAKGKGQPAPLAMQMFLYLGLLTVVWGTATCNWFGIPVDYIPAWLKNLSVPAISNVTEESIRNANLMQFCFTLGLIQLTIGHIISIVRNIRSPQILGHVGSIAMLCGMYVVVLSLVVSAERYQINQPVMIAVGGGFALNFIFSNYQTGIGQSIVDSLKNIITMFLGVVNVFADIMSYIRLWAVGLAGSAISATVNQMAGPALGSFLIFLGVLLLFFGHGLNYIMNVLSVIVHGVRLNTLEFSNHVGLTWAGFKYEPFAE